MQKKKINKMQILVIVLQLIKIIIIIIKNLLKYKDHLIFKDNYIF